MKVIRSWPLDAPPGHARCDDALPRIMTPPFDYTPLVLAGDDVLHLDWDVAVSPEDLRTFAAAARLRPLEPLVAPIRLYPGSMFGHDPVPRDLPEPVWGAKSYDDGTEQSMHYVTRGEPAADLWGFGMVYLPLCWLLRWRDDCPGVTMGDLQFSGWYHRQEGAAQLCWDVRPVHLNSPALVEL
jgi:hypothetical protein